ncbi:MAG: hypothetical protein KI793_13435 [Rivularia sp. (in: Bacteria)]|nr:hypothetical protein [Rivularia sp. MS3]
MLIHFHCKREKYGLFSRYTLCDEPHPSGECHASLRFARNDCDVVIANEVTQSHDLGFYRIWDCRASLCHARNDTENNVIANVAKQSPNLSFCRVWDCRASLRYARNDTENNVIANEVKQSHNCGFL